MRKLPMMIRRKKRKKILTIEHWQALVTMRAQLLTMTKMRPRRRKIVGKSLMVPRLRKKKKMMILRMATEICSVIMTVRAQLWAKTKMRPRKRKIVGKSLMVPRPKKRKKMMILRKAT
jgi:hypothetical protein